MGAFLKLQGVEGDARVKGYEGWVVLQTATAPIRRTIPAGARGPDRERGSTVPGEVILTRGVDRSTVKLAEMCAKGKMLPEVDLHFTQMVDGSEQTFMTFKLKDVIITNHLFEGHYEGKNPVEQISLNYEAVDWNFTVWRRRRRKVRSPARTLRSSNSPAPAARKPPRVLLRRTLPVPLFGGLPMPECVTTPQIEQTREQLALVRKLIEDVRSIGGAMPDLVAAADRAEAVLSRPMEAAEIGLDLAAAGEEVRQALTAYTADLKRACGNDELAGVCEARIDRVWQARGVRWVLSPEQQGSWVRLSIRNILRRHTREVICERLEWCRCR